MFLPIEFKDRKYNKSIKQYHYGVNNICVCWTGRLFLLNRFYLFSKRLQNFVIYKNFQENFLLEFLLH